MNTDASLLDGVPDLRIRDGYADGVDGVRLHYVEAGEGPLVIMLHGFPEFWYSWRKQIPAIARAGFRVVAVDMRGYNLSDKPARIRDYGAKTLAKDIDALIPSLGEQKAHVIAHDWGAGVAWAFAMAHGERLNQFALCNGPHPEALLKAMRDPAQLAKSWYMFMFQIPWLPEAIIRLDRYKLLLDGFRNEHVTPGAFTNEDIDRYVASYEIPGAITAMLAYYRAMFRPSGAPKLAPVLANVLSIWGENDPHLGRELAQPPPAKVPHARVEYVKDASHWVHHEQPEQVNALLIEHLRAHKPTD